MDVIINAGILRIFKKKWYRQTGSIYIMIYPIFFIEQTNGKEFPKASNL